MPAIRPLLIADVPWLLYRSFFGLPKSIQGADGEPVNALLGTVNALLAAIDAHRPRALVACMGAEEARYRVQLYPRYHAHRDPMPAQLASQWQQAPDLLASFGWTVFDAGDLEADDAMGSYAREEAGAGGRALLLTADRDLHQAVGDRVQALDLKSGAFAVIGPDQVRERVGVEPALVPDLIALRGDPSDGLPGAPGIGAKTAAALLSDYGSLGGVLAAAERDDPGMSMKTAVKLRDSAAQLCDFKEIATLVSIDVGRPEDGETDFAAGAAAAQALGMQALAKRLRERAEARP
ncbi:MAG TPA: 5'-3' exonuclease H3TH domain-containing protein [Solirubrobacteraceae bacterium]|jgi:DNA polymerase-1|nr:5'-3' exonuclease H3TH domain-containing protein [Solirubrobacteraceae bacterium]